MGPVTDLFGRVAEQSVDPLQPWQWVLCVIGTLALLALSAFVGAIFSGNYGGFSWGAALFIMLLFNSCLLPMYRAIPPGTNLYWWLLTGTVAAISVALFFVAHQTGTTPNPLHALGAPVAAIGVSTILDLVSERLAGIPLAWPSAIILVGVGVFVVFAIANDQNR